MKLHEKILYCRKKAGLSQEALADQIGISRQAVSKWETGEAVPEINKLLLLSNVFQVTTDWLLSEEAPAEETTPPSSSGESQNAQTATWVDSIPGVIGRLLRRFGWLFGVYLAAAGACMTGLGALAQQLVRNMFQNDFVNTIEFSAEEEAFFSNDISTSISGMVQNNPVSTMGRFMVFLGIILMIAGIILAVVLKRKFQSSRHES